MKKKITLYLVFLGIVFLLYAGLTGLPVSSHLKEKGCFSEYQTYLFPRTVCQFVTFGHCATSAFNKYDAEMEIASCLCDTYQKNPDEELERAIYAKCSSVRPTCDESIERIRLDYCNDNNLDSLECEAFFHQRSAEKIDFICQNKEEIFHQGFIF